MKLYQRLKKIDVYIEEKRKELIEELELKEIEES